MTAALKQSRIFIILPRLRPIPRTTRLIFDHLPHTSFVWPSAVAPHHSTVDLTSGETAQSEQYGALYCVVLLALRRVDLAKSPGTFHMRVNAHTDCPRRRSEEPFTQHSSIGLAPESWTGFILGG